MNIMVKKVSESDTKVKTDVKLKKKEKTIEKSVSVVEEAVVEKPALQEPIVEKPVEEVVLAESLNVTVVNEVQEETNTEILFNKLINQFLDIQLVMKTLHSNLKVLQKEVLKERKESKKKESKIKKKSTKKRSPSGFAKPSKISDGLADFLNLPSGTELARTDVTSKVIAYIKEHDLQNPSNRKQILLDDKLNKLLLPGSEDVVTFFNLQTYLKKHFAVHQSVDTSVATTVDTTVI